MFKLILLLAIVSSAYADETLKFKATYTVPTARAEDAPLMTFDLEDYTALKREVAAPTKAKLSYILPARMTGIKQSVEMELMIEELPNRVFKGDTAVALCTGAWKEMKCQIRFTYLQYNTRTLDKVLRKEGMSEMDISTRIENLKTFAGDPVGFTTVIGQ
ncbi:MAG: hypothetical protein H0V66_02000 [Bdellovibrionales bacterium]|nr:hypothetical protein [Bdellovibrionales bacterium]